MNTIVFATIGLPVKDEQEPIFFTMLKYNPSRVFLISSLEEYSDVERGSVEDLVAKIALWLNPLKVDPEIYKYPLGDFETNKMEICKLILEEIFENPIAKIIIDTTGGRGIISTALQHATILSSMIAKQNLKYNQIKFIGINKPHGHDLIEFDLIPERILTSKEKKILEILMYEPGIAQIELKKRIGIQQPTISKFISRMSEEGYINKSGNKKYISPKGESMLKLLKLT